MSKPKTHRQRAFWERIIEVVPAFLTWGAFVVAVYLSATRPAWAAAYIIAFDVYWILKALNSVFHLLHSFRRYQHDVELDWHLVLKKMGDPSSYRQWLDERYSKVKKKWRKIIIREKERFEVSLPKTSYQEIYHAILIPFVDESEELLRTTLTSIAEVNYPKDRIILVLAAEERAGEQAQVAAQKLKQEFAQTFNEFLISVHPDGLPGEIKGKSANASFAAEHVLTPYVEEQGIDPDCIIISNLDADTIIHPQYLARVTYEWLLAPNPHKQSYQPIALYNNNIWDSPGWVRIVTVANTFWLLIESSRPDRLATFSSHSMSYKTLREVGFWRKDVVSEDSCIFWQCFFHYHGDYKLQPVFVPVSMDTCMAENYKKTLVNQYKQRRRWAYNVEYFPWFSKEMWSRRNKIPLKQRLIKFFLYTEGNYHWATASIVIASLGFLPAYISSDFRDTVWGFNLPYMAQALMTIAIAFIVFSIYVNIKLLPPRPKRYNWKRTLGMYLQWIWIPPASIIWVSIPAIDAQTRVALGKYMEFWVTPKTRKDNTASAKTVIKQEAT